MMENLKSVHRKAAASEGPVIDTQNLNLHDFKR